MAVADRIDTILQERGVSRRQLAIKAGIPPSSLQSALERGHNITLDMLQKIADALGVPVFLLYDVDIFVEEVTDFAKTLVQMYSVLNVIAENPGTPEDTRKQIKEILPEKEKFTRQVTTLSMMSRKSVDIPPAFASDDVKAIFELLGQLNSKGQERAIAQIQDLAKVPDYQKETSPK
ncbi:helix-turn-helix domain-containing protein [Hydrogeniiclostridium mannosilyticum]|uniref:helix-turn-helix domain-containing protein n=1 Tax=Hydrogeniiclostridium mannosilyticum TaxID=2764322 RepID=UPI00399B9939